MATQHANDEADIRQQINKLVEAIRAMDLEGVKSIYAPDIVSFDIVPPLQRVGAEAQWKNWANILRHTGLRSVTDPIISRSAWVMTWHSGIASIGSAARRRTGTEPISGFDGRRAFRKIDGNWLIVTPPGLVPVDFENGRALLIFAA